jgi:hypothetical protein
MKSDEVKRARASFASQGSSTTILKDGPPKAPREIESDAPTGTAAAAGAAAVGGAAASTAQRNIAPPEHTRIEDGLALKSVVTWWLAQAVILLLAVGVWRYIIWNSEAAR